MHDILHPSIWLDRLPTGSERILDQTQRKIEHIRDLSYDSLVKIRELLVKRYGVETYAKMLQNVIWQSKIQVSMFDFCEFCEIRNNFSVFFYEEFRGTKMRGQWFYQRFKKQHRENEKELLKIFGQGEYFDRRTLTQKALLYKAYMALLADDEVISNRQLFV